MGIQLLFSSSCAIKIFNYPITVFSARDRIDLRFKKIDNQVKVYIEDRSKKLIYDSGIIPGNPDMDTTLNLSDLIGKGTKKIFIELFNTQGGKKNPWEIEYELIVKGIIIEYVHEKSQKGDNYVGQVYSKEHIIKVQKRYRLIKGEYY